jgi:hypothetical protein
VKENAAHGERESFADGMVWFLFGITLEMMVEAGWQVFLE